jgi:DNA-binding transcriptional LysR family regulator
MNRDDVRYFLAVRAARSIKGAARALKVDHTTVGRRLAALEIALGVSLFERTPDGLVETDIGRAVAPIAERMEVVAAEITEAAHAASDSLAGPVRIAAPPLIADHFLVPALPALRQRFPQVELELYSGVASVDMPRREADLAIRVHPPGTSPGEDSLLSRRVAKFGYALFATPSYVDTHGLPERPIRGLRGHELVGNGHPLLMAWNTELEEPAAVPLTVFPFVSNFAAVVAGLGLGLVACVAGDDHPGLIRLSDVIGQWDLWLVTNPDARNNRRVRAVKDAIAELLAAAAERLGGGRMEPAVSDAEHTP